MSLNLIADAWIPVRCTNGRRIIRPDQIAEADVLFPDWPRADLNIACLELLIGLVYLADPALEVEDWADRQADPERRSRRLRRRPGGEHDPAIARPVYSPNGLNGRALVDTSTDFVSR